MTCNVLRRNISVNIGHETKRHYQNPQFHLLIASQDAYSIRAEDINHGEISHAAAMPLRRCGYYALDSLQHKSKYPASGDLEDV
jgi:hypothetical protein